MRFYLIYSIPYIRTFKSSVLNCVLSRMGNHLLNKLAAVLVNPDATYTPLANARTRNSFTFIAHTSRAVV